MIDPLHLRAWWAHRQGLDGSLAGKSAAQVLEHCGWARSVGGASPYLTLFSRAGIDRQTADAAIAKLEIHELPSARGCTYVLPASDFALGITASQSDTSELKLAEKLGVTRKEIDKLCDAVVGALEKQPLDPEGLREAVGKAARNLGEEGKKKGLTTTLPVALGILQTKGEIRRIPVNGRIDQQRYKYTAWRPNPLSKSKIDPEQVPTELARRYFRWIGPATIAEFQWFSALGVKAAKAAVEPLKLEPLDNGSDRLMFPEDREALQKFRAPKEPHYALIGCIDSVVLLRRDLKGQLDAKDTSHPMFKDPSAKAGSGLMDLPTNGILDRGRVVGLWDFDPEANQVVWTSFVKKDKALQAAVSATEEYAKSQLGDVRTFSLDSPKSRAPRLAALRAS